MESLSNGGTSMTILTLL